MQEVHEKLLQGGCQHRSACLWVQQLLDSLEDAKPKSYTLLCLSAFSYGVFFSNTLIAVVVDIKKFYVSSKVTLKLGLILSLTGTQGGCCCVVLQPCAAWDHPASQLSGGPAYPGSPGDRRAGDRGSHRGVWERSIPTGEC